MFPFNFQKSKAEYFLKCISEGDSIKPIDFSDNWTIDDMLGLAGACMFAIGSHGPLLRKAAAEIQGMTLEDSEAPEHIEADDELVANDVCGAIQLAANFTHYVKESLYDKSFDEIVRCLVTQKEQAEIHIRPISGFKQK
jgi:hypothetical protein